MGDNRPAVYLENNNVIYRASALGGCLRALYAARCGMDRRPIPDIIQRGMDEGTALEPTILDLLQTKHDFHFVENSRQHVVELDCGKYNGKNLIVRGSVDALVYSGGGNTVLPVDVKAFTNDDVELYFSDKRWYHFPRYAYQQSVYAHGSGTEFFLMPIFNKATWQIEPKSLRVVSAPYGPEEIRNRVLSVERSYSALSMPQDCPCDYACPYPYIHDPPARSEPPAASQALIDARINLSNKIRVLEAARQYLDDQITKHLTEGESYTHDGHTISLLHKSNRFNIKAAQELLTEADIDWQHDPDFVIPGEGTYIRITKPRKQKSND